MKRLRAVSGELALRDVAELDHDRPLATPRYVGCRGFDGKFVAGLCTDPPLESVMILAQGLLDFKARSGARVPRIARRQIRDRHACQLLVGVAVDRAGGAIGPHDRLGVGIVDDDSFGRGIQQRLKVQFAVGGHGHRVPHMLGVGPGCMPGAELLADRSDVMPGKSAAQRVRSAQGRIPRLAAALGPVGRQPVPCRLRVIEAAPRRYRALC